ncbi:type IV pili methyl-accepting chemotaxis transducer N-terminal domain-containing protein [Ferrimonas balearica]|uniref:type IV pili methyl-accepting chemotaxis transducer N-terminal domain-containing protein n=1 Tax=Ferrimonas balearica TaxID=44012 RepID=UPI001F23FBC1|nr:type IV pili methyl-accepting chemotaxis transducer N-terminal domain-containing protein [Ferrimonas balearica]MBY6019042.1 type IV pili methyl-accepting chemotaxis transducer N-terminal domain-containing protein [Halomonas denitrificans]MBY6095644.1 type IV pili methyl-accepting chemotaxis transducer N-terminal domain-containing protein [Ferrimonas balearica]
MARTTRLTTSVIHTMLLVTLLFCLQGGISLITALYSTGDAQAINDSGSLRMRSYQLLFLANSEGRHLEQKLEEFETILYSPALARSEAWYMPAASGHTYRLVKERWTLMKEYAQEGNSRRYVREVKRFVDEIDAFVDSLEKFSALKLRVLMISQILTLALMGALTVYALFFVRRQFAQPLERLERGAEAIAARNFAFTPQPSRYRELNTLGQTLASTARDLDTLYQQLESKVVSQDLALRQAHERLTFLYDAAQTLSSTGLESSVLTRLMTALQQHLDADGVCLQLEGERPLCLGCNEGEPARASLNEGGDALGEIRLYPADRADRDLLKNFALLLGRAVQQHRDLLMQERLGLMEERAVIARELHDSLGQLLAYMKIQLTLLNRATQAGSPEGIEEARQALKVSVDNAYRQLRELLATFRLKVEAPDLPSALECILNELEERSDATLTLDYRLPPMTLSATQQVHLLQLMREAVVNAIKHAGADHIQLRCMAEGDKLVMSVEDDGIGMTTPDNPENHFGLNIMQERARQMGGTLRIDQSPLGGVRVQVAVTIPSEDSHG